VIWPITTIPFKTGRGNNEAYLLETHMFVKTGDGKIVAVIKTDEDLEREKQLAKQAKEEEDCKSKESN
jgi:hypothetical protein